MQQVVGLGDMKASNREEDTLITFSLGSCIGLSLYDPDAKVGGLIHCVLPLSKTDPEKAKKKPCVFTDTGVTGLLQAVFDLGAERKRLIAKVAGAAKLHEHMKSFKIGERNYTVLRRILWKNDILIAGEDVGGAVARTMRLDMRSGRTLVRSNLETREL